MSKLWLTIEQDEQDYFVVKDGEGNVLYRALRTRPSKEDVPANKWAETLVSEVQSLARFGMSVQMKGNPESARF